MKTRVYVSVIVKNEDEKALIIRRSPDSRFAAGQWEFVNGSIDPGETAEQAAIRELYEETGLGLDEEGLTPGPVHDLSDADGRWVVIPYFARVSDAHIRLSSEHTEHRWADEAEILAVPHVGEDYKKLLALL